MKDFKLEDKDTQSGKCGDDNQVKYYCNGEDRYCGESNQCGVSEEHKSTQQTQYQYKAYVDKKNECKDQDEKLKQKVCFIPKI